jgi:hypothetical protein
MFRDIYAERYELRVRPAESGLWVWEVWDLNERRLVQSSTWTAERRFLSSRDAFVAGRAYAAGLPPPPG